MIFGNVDHGAFTGVHPVEGPGEDKYKAGVACQAFSHATTFALLEVVLKSVKGAQRRVLKRLGP